MYYNKLFLAAASFLAPGVFGHGQVTRVITETATYIADNAYGTTVTPGLPIRKLSEMGPAAPFTGVNITCGPGGNIPVSTTAPIRAGSQVTFDWNPWGSDHKGPIMTYLARCPNGCSTFKGDSGNVWVKIDHDGFDANRTPKWAEEKLHNPGYYTVTIPSAIPDGEYLLRHEVLGLHVAGTLNGAQFYPTCVQIKVSGGTGTSWPTGIALPGAYQPNDPGILVELWRIGTTTPTYTIPGGPVLIGGGSVPPPSSSSRPASSSVRTSTSSTRPASSSSSPRTTTSTASGAVQTAWGQCGGQGWTGPTACVSGYRCNATNQYYSQCIPV